MNDVRLCISACRFCHLIVTPCSHHSSGARTDADASELTKSSTHFFVWLIASKEDSTNGREKQEVAQEINFIIMIIPTSKMFYSNLILHVIKHFILDSEQLAIANSSQRCLQNQGELESMYVYGQHEFGVDLLNQAEPLQSCRF